MKRVVVYELTNDKKDVYVIGNHAEAEQHERASAERESRDPRSNIKSYHFEWRPDSAGNGAHSWYE